MTLNSNFSNSTMDMNKSNVVDPTEIFGPQRDSLYIVLPITIIYSIIFTSGLFGNILTCIIIIQNRNLHTATNFYLFSLAISDLLLLVSGMPQEIYSIWSKWPYVFGNEFCVLRGLAAETSTNASVLTITLFTVERYVAICHPFLSHQMSKLSRAIKHVLLLWAVSLALALPQALQFGVKEHRGVTMCLQVRVIVKHSFEISSFLFFFAPMILITVLYTLIGLKLYKSNIGENIVEGNELTRNIVRFTIHNRRSTQSTKRVINMLVAVVVTFFMCWAPFHTQRLVAIYSTTENHLAKSPFLLSVYLVMTYLSGVLYYMSTCINPIFYHLMSNKFREAFKISSFLFFFAPMILITVLYTLIGLKLYKSNIGENIVEGNELTRNIVRFTIHNRRSTQSTKRVINMLVAVVVTFFMCWAPFHTQRLVAIYSTTENHLAKSPFLLSVYLVMTYLSGVLYYMSTCINPIFYHLMSNKFREAFKNTIWPWCCPNTSQVAAQQCSYNTGLISRHVNPGRSVNPGNFQIREEDLD